MLHIKILIKVNFYSYKIDAIIRAKERRYIGGAVSATKRKGEMVEYYPEETKRITQSYKKDETATNRLFKKDLGR